MSPRSIGFVTAAVLRAVADGHRYGADIVDATDVGSGSVYKVLRRLERRGHVTGRWEDPEVAEAERRPRRRYYELTPAGHRVMEEALERFRELGSAADRLAEGRG
ncbi:MAG: PadR family transcriptional regulator [Gemmatimonadetes bacterium]|nr:PadR family transcriptional regulator [Gemmatimonadota bacterium]